VKNNTEKERQSKVTTINCNIDRELLYEFKIQALKDKSTMTKLIISWIEEYLRKAKGHSND
jgi:hypothetical protein